MHPTSAFVMSNTATDTNVYVHQQQTPFDEFPERPGQPECSYYLKTGDCKFRSNCKYHHPKNQIPKSSPCPLSDKGLPLRPVSLFFLIGCFLWRIIGLGNNFKTFLFMEQNGINSLSRSSWFSKMSKVFSCLFSTHLLDVAVMAEVTSAPIQAHLYLSFLFFFFRKKKLLWGFTS